MKIKKLQSTVIFTFPFYLLQNETVSFNGYSEHFAAVKQVGRDLTQESKEI
jgi:hypothetical protein